MKLDPQQMRALASLSDVELWEKVVSIGESHGFTVPKQPPSPEDMRRLRQVLTAGETIRLTDAVRLVNEYRKKYGG